MADVSHDLLLAYPLLGRREARARAVAPARGAAHRRPRFDDASTSWRRGAGDRSRRWTSSSRSTSGCTGSACRPPRTRSRSRCVWRSSRRSASPGITFYPGHIRESVEGAAGEPRAAAARPRGAASSGFDRAGRAAAGGERRLDADGVADARDRRRDRGATRHVRLQRPDDGGDRRLRVGRLRLHGLATVVSTAVPGQAVIDAGCKGVRPGADARRRPGEGFGALLDRREVIGARMSEEHGILDLSHIDWRPQVGDQVRIVPNHVCIVVHLNDVIYGVRDTSWRRVGWSRLEGEWRRKLASKGSSR